MPDENNISELIRKFTPGNLKDLEAQKLLSRVDTKFIVPREKLIAILSRFIDKYSILEVKSKREFDYYSRYYDTPDYYFYLCHHNGRCNRYKIRYRLYNDSAVAYMEVKHKSKGGTQKTRVQSPADTPEITSADRRFISGEVGDISDLLVPKLDITYKRITLFSTEDHDKITIDRNINFRSVEFGKSVSLDKIVLLEVKSKKGDCPAYPLMVLKEMGFHCRSISKYCLGIAVTCNDVKHNKFKRNILTINKLSDGNPT